MSAVRARVTGLGDTDNDGAELAKGKIKKGVNIQASASDRAPDARGTAAPLLQRSVFLPVARCSAGYELDRTYRQNAVISLGGEMIAARGTWERRGWEEPHQIGKSELPQA